jgi:hypothetical protein
MTSASSRLAMVNEPTCPALAPPLRGHDLYPDVLPPPLLCQVLEWLAPGVFRPYATMQHGFVHDGDEADGHGTPLYRLLLKVDPGGHAVFDQIIRSASRPPRRPGPTSAPS